MPRVQLSKNFFLDEFTHSETATRMGREIEVPDEVLAELIYLCQHILQPLRDDVRKAIFITSGYRPKWLNKLIRGSSTSDHIYGRASDLRVAGMTPYHVCKRVQKLNLPYGQLIHEFGRWTHVSSDRGKRRLHSLTAHKVKHGRGTRTAYIAGIQPLPPPAAKEQRA